MRERSQMSKTMRVGVRHRNGSMNILEVKGVTDWAEARAYVLGEVSSAAAVLVLIQGGKGRPAMKVAA